MNQALNTLAWEGRRATLGPQRQREAGSSILIAMIAVFVVSAMTVFGGRLFSSQQAKYNIDRVVDARTSAAIASTVMFEKLLTLSGGGTPQGIYLEPYLTNNPMAALVKVYQGATPTWSPASTPGQFSLQAPNTANFTPSDLSTLYGTGVLPPSIATKTAQTNIQVLGFDKAPGNPYWIQSIVVSATPALAGGLSAAAPTRPTIAKIAVAAPPPPTCTITATQVGASTSNSSTMSVKVITTGIVASGWFFNGSSQIPFPPGPNGAPTAAVRQGVIQTLLSVPITDPCPISQALAQANYRAQVVGVDGSANTCKFVNP